MHLSGNIKSDTVVLRYNVSGRTNFEKLQNTINILPAGINIDQIIELANDFCTIDQDDILRIEAGELIGYDFSTNVHLTRNKSIHYIGGWSDKLFEYVNVNDVLSFAGISATVVDVLFEGIVIQRTTSNDQMIIIPKMLHSISGYKVPYVKVQGK